MEDRQKFLINNVFVFTNRIISKLITLIILLVIARNYSVSQFGDLVLIITTTTIFSFILDFGSNTLIVREVAINNENRFFLVRNVLLTKLIIFPLISISFIFFITRFNLKIDYLAIIFFALGIFFESSLLTLIKQFEGLEKMNISSFLTILERIIIGLSLIFIETENLFLRYSLSYLISNSITFFLAFFLSYLGRQVLASKFNINDVKYVVINSFVFFLFGIFSIIYNRADTFLLQKISGSEQLGLYRASFQIIESIYFIPMSLGVSILPLFSRIQHSSYEKFLKFYNFLFRVIFIFGLLITLFIYNNSFELINLLFGEKFSKGYNILQLLSLTIIIFFMNSFIGNTLIALKRERIQFLSMFVGTIIKVILLFILTFNMGVIGACLAVIVGEIVNLVIQSAGLLDVKFSFQKELMFESFPIIFLLIFHSTIKTHIIFSVLIYSIIMCIIFLRFFRIYKELA